MKRTTISERAVVLAPRGRDAAIAAAMLNEAGIAAAVCGSYGALIGELDAGVGFVVLTEEALSDNDLHPLSEWLDAQQEWSDLPFVLLTMRGGGLERNPAAGRYLEVLGNVTFLERPFHPTTLVSLARSALRGRRRQYEARARLENLKESEGRFRAAVGAVQGLLWTNDAEGRMTGEQPGWAALTGQSQAEYEGSGWASAIHPEDAQATVEAWNAAVTDHRPFLFEHRLRRHDGTWGTYAIHAVPVLADDGEVREWVGVHRDISEARQAEAALREESQTLETLNLTGAAIAGDLDLERVVQTVTTAGVSLVGAEFGAFFYNVLDANGESYMLYTLAGAERSSFENFEMPRATAVFKPTFVGEGVIRSDDIMADPRYGKSAPHYGMPKGHLPVRSYLAVPVASRSGEVIGGLFFGHSAGGRFTDRHEQLMRGIAGQAAVAIDNATLYKALQKANETLEQRVADEVAERAKAEEALRQSQKMEAIGQLTGGVAHDFNNLLTVIRSSSDLLRRPELTEERRRRYIDAISDTVDRAAKLTSQLLAFARRQALKPEIFDVADRLDRVSDMLRTIVGSRIPITVGPMPEPVYVKADVSQFETTLVNIAVNARDAMDEEGALSIRVDARKAIGGFVAISISDTGHGIAEDKLKQIFEPFYTTKGVGKGTGLGLSQVYGFAKQSGGDVQVTSKPGQGTTFTLLLPRADTAPSATLVSADVSLPDEGGNGRRVLVVEDNLDVGVSSTQILQDLGYRTIWAKTGHEALEILASEQGFDAVFSDVVMPGMSGIELGQEIRRRHPELPVVLTSGYSDVLAEHGRHGFELLQKPYAADQLSRILRRLMATAV